MARSHYADYASHAMRFYARHQHLRGKMEFMNEVEMLNWNACTKALLQFDPADRDILLEIYRERDTFPDNVYMASQKYCRSQDMIWTLNTQFLMEFAKIRGLI